jgi:hypothetical protein
MWYPQRSDRETDQHVENRWAPVEIFGPWLFAAYSLFFWTLVKVCVEHKSCLRSSIKCVNDRIDFLPLEAGIHNCYLRKSPHCFEGQPSRNAAWTRWSPSASLLKSLKLVRALPLWTSEHSIPNDSRLAQLR